MFELLRMTFIAAPGEQFEYFPPAYRDVNMDQSRREFSCTRAGEAGPYEEST